MLRVADERDRRDLAFVFADLVGVAADRSHGQAGFEVPELDDAIGAGGGQQMAVGLPGDAQHMARMPLERAHQRTIGDAEHFHQPIGGAGGQKLAIGRKSDARRSCRDAAAGISRTSLPSATFQSFNSPDRAASPPPVASSLPSGLKSSERTRSTNCDGSSALPIVSLQFPRAGHRPDAQLLVGAGGNQFAVAGERQRDDSLAGTSNTSTAIPFDASYNRTPPACPATATKRLSAKTRRLGAAFAFFAASTSLFFSSSRCLAVASALAIACSASGTAALAWSTTSRGGGDEIDSALERVLGFLQFALGISGPVGGFVGGLLRLFVLLLRLRKAV